MILSKIGYREFFGAPRYWELEPFELGQINLIVGQNASGKTRILKLIFGLSRLLTSTQLNIVSGFFDAFFTEENIHFNYVVEFEDGMILQEKLIRNEFELFTRNSEGIGKIFNEDLGKFQDFKIPKNQLVVARRDEIQFPYLEGLFQWASNTRYFRFSKEEEKHTLALIDSNQPKTDINNQNMTNQAVAVFRKGLTDFRKEFLVNIINDFNSIGYNISKVDSGILHSIRVDSTVGSKVVGLRVYETDRNVMTDQNEMSDGMFRALSLIIHYNYYELSKEKLNVLIDDIGEGLDYERSTNLIKLLIDKTKKTNIQLIMSSNDKFVMNNTNLEYWQIVSREGGHVKMYNKSNSEEIFKEFKFTGLNNFDFLTTEFYKTENE